MAYGANGGLAGEGEVEVDAEGGVGGGVGGGGDDGGVNLMVKEGSDGEAARHDVVGGDVDVDGARA